MSFSFGNRLGEQETTDEELKIDETSSGENVDVKVNVDDDDDVTIEEFSDWLDGVDVFVLCIF